MRQDSKVYLPKHENVRSKSQPKAMLHGLHEKANSLTRKSYVRSTIPI